MCPQENTKLHFATLAKAVVMPFLVSHMGV